MASCPASCLISSLACLSDCPALACQPAPHSLHTYVVVAFAFLTRSPLHLRESRVSFYSTEHARHG